MSLSQQAVRDEVEAKLRLTTALSGSIVSEHFGAMVAVVDYRAKSEDLVRASADGNPENFDEVEINRQVQALYGSRSDLTGVALMDVHGVLRASATSPQLVGRDFSERGYFQGVVATGEPFVSGVFGSASSGATRYLVSIAAYVRAASVDGGTAGRPLAVLVVSIGLDDIQAVVDDLARAEGVSLWVTDQNDMVVAKPGGLPSNLEPVSNDPIGAAAQSPSGELGVIGPDTDEALVVREVAGPPGWALFATIGRDEAYAGADRIRVAVLAIGIPLALVVCVGITVLLMMQRRQWDAGAHLSRRSRRSAGGEPPEIVLPGEHEPRIADPAELHPRVRPPARIGQVDLGTAGQCLLHGSVRRASPRSYRRGARHLPDGARSHAALPGAGLRPRRRRRGYWDVPPAGRSGAGYESSTTHPRMRPTSAQIVSASNRSW